MTVIVLNLDEWMESKLAISVKIREKNKILQKLNGYNILLGLIIINFNVLVMR